MRYVTVYDDASLSNQRDYIDNGRRRSFKGTGLIVQTLHRDRSKVLYSTDTVIGAS